MFYTGNRMKKLLLLVVLLAPLFSFSEENNRQLRIALRSQSSAILSGSEENPAQRGGGWKSDDFLYDVWKIRGPERIRVRLIENLRVIELEHPKFYEVARRKVKMFRMNPNTNRSWAFAPHGNIGLGQGAFEKADGTPRIGLFFLTLIHEMQHCNTYGDVSEGAACYAMGYYGRKTKAILPSRFLLRYYDALALKKGYNAAKWQAKNILPTNKALNN